MAASAWQGSGEGLPVCRPLTWTLQWWRASQQPSGCSDEGANPFRTLHPRNLIAAAGRPDSRHLPGQRVASSEHFAGGAAYLVNMHTLL